MSEEREKVEITEVKLEDSEMHRVLELALEAGRILLHNGAEIFRVEETIAHICKRFDIQEMDAFVLSNGIFITAHSKGKEIFAKVKHVPMGGTHLGIVTAVNSLSRQIYFGEVGIDEAFERLKEIEKMPPKRNLTMILAAGIGSGMFCYLMKGNILESAITVLIGALLYVFVLFAEKHNISKIIINLVGGAMITILALVVTNLPIALDVTLEKMIIGSILPLVPGVLFTNAIRDIASSDFISGVVKLLNALLVFVYIATGVGTVLSIYESMLGGIML